MIETCFIKKHNICLINIWDLFDKQIETNIINTLSDYQLLKANLPLNNQDIKKIIYHNFIHDICNFIINMPEGKAVFCIYKDPPKELEIYNYCTPNQINKLVNSLFKKISFIIPITHVPLNKYDNIHNLCSDYDNAKGEAIDTIKSIINAINKQKKRKFTLEPVKKLTHKYKLYFLNNNYFEQLKVKSYLSMR